MAVMVLRKFRLLLDVLWGSPNDGDVPTYDAGLDKLVMAPQTGGGAPDTGDYLVGTAQAGLSNEVVVGATPNGELGGTWGAITVDTTHSGSSHADVQAAAEATAAAALAAHLADGTDAHDASAISSIAAGNLAATDVQTALNELDSEKASAADLSAHLNDTADAHDASAISILDTANDFTATDVEGALAELQSDAEADATALADHLADTADAHDASAISFTPAGTIAASTVQAAIEEVAVEAGSGAWTLDVDLPLDSLTGWTVNAGTWAIAGGVLENTSPSGRLVYDADVRLGEYLVEAEVQVGAGAYVGFGSQTNGDGVHVVVRLADDNVVYVQTYAGLEGTLAVPGGVTQDVWYKLRVHYVGSFVEVWVDDVYLGSVNGSIIDRRVQKLQLATHNPGVTNRYRNLKFWSPTLPA